MNDYVGNALAGLQKGMQLRSQMETQDAMNALMQNPNDTKAMGRLGAYNPDAAMKFQDRQLQQQREQSELRQQQLSESREKLKMTVGLLSQARDPQAYAQARQAAIGMGLDVSGAPEQYDPNYVAQATMQSQALLGQIDQELMAVAPGTTVIDKRTGKPVYNNPRPARYIPVQAGGRLVLDPSSVPGSKLEGMVGEDDDEWEVITPKPQGGQTQPASGNFRP